MDRGELQQQSKISNSKYHLSAGQSSSWVSSQIHPDFPSTGYRLNFLNFHMEEPLLHVCCFKPCLANTSVGKGRDVTLNLGVKLHTTAVGSAQVPLHNCPLKDIQNWSGNNPKAFQNKDPWHRQMHPSSSATERTWYNRQGSAPATLPPSLAQPGGQLHAGWAGSAAGLPSSRVLQR